MIGNAIQDKIKIFPIWDVSSFHYYKIKGFDRDSILILGFLKKKKGVRPTALTMLSPVKRRLVFSI